MSAADASIAADETQWVPVRVSRPAVPELTGFLTVTIPRVGTDSGPIQISTYQNLIQVQGALGFGIPFPGGPEGS